MKKGAFKTAFKRIEGTEVIGIIQRTNDYSLFTFIKENRPVDHAVEIAESMKIEVLFSPIKVNEKMEIIDGQNSFTARKMLGLPIDFIVLEGYGVEQMQRYNQVIKSWSLDNFLHSNVAKNNENYLKFECLRNNYKVNISDLIHIIANLSDNYSIGEGDLTVVFKKGELIITPYTYNKVEEFLIELSLFNKYEYCRHTSFVRAFLKLYEQDFYNKEYIRKRIDIGENNFNVNRKTDKIEYLIFLADKVYTDTKRKILVTYNKELKGFFVLQGGRKGKNNGTINYENII